MSPLTNAMALVANGVKAVKAVFAYAKPAAWQRMDDFIAGLTGTTELLPSQQKFLALPHPNVGWDMRLFQGGIGCGKSFAAVIMGLALCRQTPGIHGLMVAPTNANAREGILNDYLRHLRTLGWVEGVDFLHKKTDRRLIFPQWVDETGTPSQIYFRGVSNPDRVPKLTVGWIHVEEMGDFPKVTIEQLQQRLRQKIAKQGSPQSLECYRFFGTSTPQDITPQKPKRHRPVYISPDELGWLETWFSPKNIRNQNSDWFSLKRVIASSLENTFLPKSYLYTLLHMYRPAKN